MGYICLCCLKDADTHHDVRVVDGLPTVVARQDLAHVVVRQVVELFGERAGTVRVGPFARALVFGVERRAGRFFLVPGVEAGRGDVLPLLAADEDGLGIGAPRSGEIDLLDTRGGGELAVVEEVAMLLPLGGGGGGDVTVGQAVQLAVVEDGE